MAEAPLKILIVEDEIHLQNLYRTAFERAGFIVRISSEGMSAITEILEFQPDIVLLDLMMPQVNGYEVLSALQNNSDIHLPVIVCSNRTDTESRRKAMDLGATEYLIKIDYPPSKLVQEVSRIFQKWKK